MSQQQSEAQSPADSQRLAELVTSALEMGPPPTAALWLSRCTLRLSAGDYEGAAADACQCLLLSPADPAAHGLLYRALRAAGEHAAASTAAQRFVEATRGTERHPEALDALCEAANALADDLLAAGDAGGAVEALREAIRECPARWEGWCRRSVAQLRRGELVDALSDVLYAGSRYFESKLGGSEELSVVLQMGRVLDALGWYNVAADDYSRLQLFLLGGGVFGIPSIAEDTSVDSLRRDELRCRDAYKQVRASAPRTCSVAGPSGRREVFRIPESIDVTHLVPLPHTSGRPDRDPARVVAALGPAMARWPVGLRESPLGGVGVFARKRIRAGQTVYTERFLLCASRDKGRCYHCLARLPRNPAHTVACRGACGRAYCNGECEREAYEGYHGPLCGRSVEDLEALVCKDIAWSSLDVLCMWKALGVAMLSPLPRMPWSAWPAPPADVPPLSYLSRITDCPPDAGGLVHHVGAHSYTAAHQNISKALGTRLRADPAITLRSLMDLRVAVELNSFPVRSRERGARATDHGMALTLAGSMFNHSCAPSADLRCWLDEGNMASVVALRNIDAGEEVTISYVDPCAPLEDRRTALWAQYGFTCHCSKCRHQRAKAGAP
eukprot:m51a1_g9852 hypothetical protein (613) ;mRNA; r:1973854-1975692